jgi:hypothetical protein
MERTETQDEHRRFEELCALAQAGSLSTEERSGLELHLRTCAPCRAVYDEYAAIGGLGMAFLAGSDALTEQAARWDNRKARQRLFSAIRAQRPHPVISIDGGSRRPAWRRLSRAANRPWTIALVAACLMIAVALEGYRLGERKTGEGRNAAPRQLSVVLPAGQPTPAPSSGPSSDLAALESVQVSRLEAQVASGQQELARLRAASSLAEERIKELESAIGERDSTARQLAVERDRLAGQLDETGKAYQRLQTEFTDLKAEHGRSLLHTASLQSEFDNLTSATREQERRLKDDEQYLTSDRDIRELMGARKLYIADVFDVDSVSRTRKAFGRVFYTQNKSLVFYAFDLDHQPGAKNASVFQVWGQKDSEPNAGSHPMNLGILYMDSESNRRWVLRSDDPRQLAEIDAVFVTVEPHGGSQKPTGKPLLYALLRKEANHP